jgi:hypothetical protein
MFTATAFAGLVHVPLEVKIWMSAGVPPPPPDTGVVDAAVICPNPFTVKTGTNVELP